MNPTTLEARLVIESLRAGVPNPRAIASLGTMQRELESRFKKALEAVATGEPVKPILFEGSFGEGKSHLLGYLRHVAEEEGFATSYVVLSPGTPLGNAHIVLKEIARQSTVKGRNGRALRALSADSRVGNNNSWAEFRKWLYEGSVSERYSALAHLYEEIRDDEEFRVRILDDLEGNPIVKTEITRRLKEIGQGAHYDLRGGPRNRQLAGTRIQLLARWCRAFGQRGLVVLFDEAERLINATRRQRLEAYAALGWWVDVVAMPGAALLPVFSMASQARDQLLEWDSPVVQDGPALKGLQFLKQGSYRLDPVTQAQREQIRYNIRRLYRDAYGIAELPEPPPRDVFQTIRTEIRYWITVWDFARYYPDQRAEVEVEELPHDLTERPEGEQAESEETDE